VLHLAYSLDTELHVAPVGTAHDPHPLDLLERERGDLLLLVPDEPKSPNTAAIGEGEVLEFSKKRWIANHARSALA
jgi:hypothetical protein